MSAYYGYVKTHIDLFSNQNVPELQSVPEPPYLSYLRAELENLIQELLCLLKWCSKVNGADGQPKTSKQKWIRKRKEIIKLRDHCHELRRELESAVTPYLLRVNRYVLWYEVLGTYRLKALQQPRRSSL